MNESTTIVGRLNNLFVGSLCCFGGGQFWDHTQFVGKGKN
jgi:hypothetical protein